jgi:hypothetical protein
MNVLKLISRGSKKSGIFVGRISACAIRHGKPIAAQARQHCLIYPTKELRNVASADGASAYPPYKIVVPLQM